MRVLITTDIFPPDAGGPASYVPRVAAELTRRDHAVQVLTYSHGMQPEIDAALPYPVERIDLGMGRATRLRHTMARIATHIRRADIVYVNGLLIETALATLHLSRPMVAKVVGDIVWERARDKGWTKIDLEAFQEERHPWPIRLRQEMRRSALRRMRSVVVPSAYLGRIVAGWGVPAERVHVIYNACELPDASVPPATLALNTPHRLITVCRLVSWKGVDGLVALLPEWPDVGLAVVGDGPERPALEALAAKLGVTNRVQFAGQVPPNRLPALLRACHLFALNSTYEGLPHVILEALASGLPVVATAAGGTPEVVDDGANGRLVPVGDAIALRRTIREVLDGNGPPLHATLPPRFSHATMMDTTIALLEREARR
jgi:glycosyltransferase involved in cell wall biosynthesis